MAQTIIVTKPLRILCPELRLILACVGYDAAGSRWDDIQNLLSQPLDWELFLHYADHHRLEPLIYRRLQEVKQDLPESVYNRLKWKCRKNGLRLVRMTSEMLKLVQYLADVNIQSVILKGPPLAQALYGDIALRPSKDLDILVRPEELPGAGGVLEELGYCRVHPDFPLTPRRRQWCLKRDHHFTYTHQVSGLCVELHWRLGGIGLEFPFTFKEKIRHCRIADQDVPVLSKEEEFLFLINHGATHAWFRMRWLCDIGEYLSQDLDWDKVMRTVERLNMTTRLGQALILVEQLLKVPIPEKLGFCPVRDQKAWHLAQLAVGFIEKAGYDPTHNNRSFKVRSYLAQKQYEFAIRPGWMNKLKYFGVFLNPTEADIKLYALPDGLFPIYFAVRPFTWLKRRWLR